LQSIFFQKHLSTPVQGLSNKEPNYIHDFTTDQDKDGYKNKNSKKRPLGQERVKKPQQTKAKQKAKPPKSFSVQRQSIIFGPGSMSG